MKVFKINEIKNKKIIGRNVKNVEELPEINLFWAASALKINVKACEVWAGFASDYDSNEPWVSVFLNGRRISRFMVEKGEEKSVCLVRGLNPQVENEICIYKDTQPMPGDAKHSLKISKILIDDDGEFCEVKPAEMKIEFIGDSITSGEGLAGAPEQMEWIPSVFVGSESYAAQVSRYFGADFSVFSQCGWGLCWGWDGNRNNNIPSFYEKVCGVMEGDFHNQLGENQDYDFKDGSDFVVLNLGTNDNGAFFQPPWKDEKTGVEYKLELENGKISASDKEYIVQKAKDFLSLIRKHNKHAQIVWCYGMIKLNLIPECLKIAVTQWKKENGDKNIHILELDSMEDVEKTYEDKGSRGHPGKKVHKLAAEKLEKLIEKLSK